MQTPCFCIWARAVCHILTMNRPIAGLACSLHPSLLWGKNYGLLGKSQAVVPITGMSPLWHAVSFVSCHSSLLVKSLCNNRWVIMWTGKCPCKREEALRMSWVERWQRVLLSRSWNRLEGWFDHIRGYYCKKTFQLKAGLGGERCWGVVSS